APDAAADTAPQRAPDAAADTAPQRAPDAAADTAPQRAPPADPALDEAVTRRLPRPD
ncbi:MAG: hypothetical protein JOZ07_08150, partial [Solirubrobacterales bacterium]|nr:hypothetical protein [Solirubrobacterales bacterium]